MLSEDYMSSKTSAGESDTDENNNCYKQEIGNKQTNRQSTVKAGSQIDAKALRCVVLNFASGESIAFLQFFSI